MPAKVSHLDKVKRALDWSRKAGIKNWGYFIIGLPGETEESIRETIDFAKQLPLDIALFHIAAPYPGTPFFFEVVQNNWFRPGTRWEQVDMDKETVLDYPDLPRRTADVLAKTRLPRVGIPPRADDHLPEDAAFGHVDIQVGVEGGPRAPDLVHW